MPGLDFVADEAVDQLSEGVNNKEGGGKGTELFCGKDAGLLQLGGDGAEQVSRNVDGEIGQAAHGSDSGSISGCQVVF